MSRIRKAFWVTTTLATGSLPASAQAITNTVTFNGTVTTTCAINVVNGTGVMTTNGTLNNLSSKNAGGSPAQVSITTTGGVRVSLDAVTAATVPAADTGTTTWAPVYSLTGTQTVAETGNATLMTGSGTSSMNIHLTGTKLSTDAFRGGNYSATVTVRCE
ncbi:hypothetical protein [Aureimonas phyllosphaerae]|uniref:Spore coat protein U (SCPU) domain-containing protein n=1 Tax=Aureimonas phyllosphaerae TaxID=1166078 RepID=A0A7W6BS92_9HYPH|nr:hypothetical protein [Aureimonas phyllosphaerae]MBB3937101.1 hypothetical protein [Aureimonas phyllosphaerae]MBB3960784.1 hypothetical protein [Aureimonas phyllosphaerae]SFF50215.1 hypothetical protein SAMN05216566_11871 [Aureimonas phyllosphaerae]